jgi:hypothetical protein
VGDRATGCPLRVRLGRRERRSPTSALIPSAVEVCTSSERSFGPLADMTDIVGGEAIGKDSSFLDHLSAAAARLASSARTKPNHFSKFVKMRRAILLS